MSIFEQASKIGLRFTTPKGTFTVDDLWHVPLTSTVGAPNLNAMAVALYKEMQQGSAEVSFVKSAKKTTDDKFAETKLRFDIITHIIQVRETEAEAKASERERKEKKQHIMELIGQKKNENLSKLSIEELEKLMADV